MMCLTYSIFKYQLPTPGLSISALPRFLHRPWIPPPVDGDICDGQSASDHRRRSPRRRRSNIRPPIQR